MAKMTQSDRLNYNAVICGHMMQISKASENLFAVMENMEAGNNLPTRRSRMEGFYAEVILLDSFLHPNFSQEYHQVTIPVKRYIEGHLDSDLKTFNQIQIILRKIMQEANNMNLLFPEKNAAKEFEESEAAFEE